MFVYCSWDDIVQRNSVHKDFYFKGATDRVGRSFSNINVSTTRGEIVAFDF